MNQFEIIVQKLNSQITSPEVSKLKSSSGLEFQLGLFTFCLWIIYVSKSMLSVFFGRNESTNIDEVSKERQRAFLVILFFLILPCISIFFILALPALIINSIVKSRLNSTLQTVKTLFRSTEAISKELFQLHGENIQAFSLIDDNVGSAVKASDLNKSEFEQNFIPIKERATLLLEDLKAAVECNRLCKLPEATVRVKYLERKTYQFSSFLSAIEGDFNSQWRQESDKIQAIKSNRKILHTSLDELGRKIEMIDTKGKELSIPWLKNIDQIQPKQFYNLNYDLIKLEALVLEAEKIYQDINESESQIKSFKKEQYIDWWKNRLTEFNDGLEGLLERPHYTGAGFFGGRNIEWGEWPRHVVCVGATRAGKSLTIEMIMSPVLMAIRNACLEPKREYPLRAFIFDVDGTTISQLEQVGFQINSNDIIILNPYDSRRWGWATGRDVVSHDDVLSLVEVLLPADKMKQGDLSYWGPVARRLLRETIEYLIETLDTEWTLWDIISVIFYDEQRREQLFNFRPGLREQLYLNVNQPNFKHFRTVLNTIEAELGEIEGMAALWHETANKVSIREFLSSSGVLVIPEHGVKAKDALRKINSFIIELVSKLSIDEGLLPNTQQPNTWIVVDEATRIAPIPRFDDFLTNGLKRGISVIFGFQSYSKAQQEFGEKDLEAILEQCTMTALLRLDAKSAEWASEKCRSYWGEIQSISFSQGSEKGTSKQQAIGKSHQTSEGTSSQETEGTSTQTTKGGSRQLTKGTSSQRSSGGADTTTQGSSVQNTVGSSTQQTEGSSTSQGQQGVLGLFGFKNQEGWNSSSGQNVGSSTGTNQSQATGTNTSQAKATNWNLSTGTNESVSEGDNWSESQSTNQSLTTGTNSSITEGTSTSETTGDNESESTTISVQINPQKLARIEPEDFAHFPEVSPTTGMMGVFLMRDIKTKSQVMATKMELSWELVASALVGNGVLDTATDGNELESGNQFRIHPQYTREVLKRLRENSSQK